MTDIEIKLISALLGTATIVVSAIVSTCVGILLFLWGEGRRRYLQATAGIRVMIMMSQMLGNAIRCDRRNVAEVKVEWMSQYLEGFFCDSDAYGILNDIIELQMEWMSGRLGSTEKAKLLQKNIQCTSNSKNVWKNMLNLGKDLYI